MAVGTAANMRLEQDGACGTAAHLQQRSVTLACASQRTPRDRMNPCSLESLRQRKRTRTFQIKGQLLWRRLERRYCGLRNRARCRRLRAARPPKRPRLSDRCPVWPWYVSLHGREALGRSSAAHGRGGGASTGDLGHRRGRRRR
jgi:hypothetical protein